MAKHLQRILLMGTVLLIPSAGLAQEKAAPEKSVETSSSPTASDGGFLEQAKHPTSWLDLGADQRLREVYMFNPITASNGESDWHYQRYRSRFWASAKLNEDISLNTRLVWEWRNWCHRTGMTSNPNDMDEVLFDEMNVKWKNAFGQPLTITVGRQDIILGNGWLVLDGTPLDGSRTIFFDAARATYEADAIKTTFDLMYIEQKADVDWFIKPFNDQNRNVAEQDERGAVLYVTNKSIQGHVLDGYFIYRHTDRVDHGGDDADIYLFGARAAGGFGENWKYRAEFAQELGKKNGATLCAFGFNSRLSYLFNDSLKNELRFDYEFLSGDDPNTATDEGFDIMWGRWPQNHEIVSYLFAGETRIAQDTNYHRLGLGWTTRPCEKIELCVDYGLYFADENTFAGRAGFSKSGNFRGQAAQLLMKYKFNDNIKGHAMADFFFPGDYYDDSRNDFAAMLRYELIFSW